MGKRNYYVDILRIILAAGVFCYHSGILPGGFLAVCGFFVMTGYYATKSLNNDNLNLKKYYLKRLTKIYVPLLVVTFLTIIVFVLCKITWVSMKPETTSVLFGYNNFWQIQANNDYFVRNSETPFIHFWYIAIALQFELLFPVLYINIKKLFNKESLQLRRTIVFLITLILSILFIYFSFNKTQMFVYYGTISRLFSIFIGISLYYCDFDSKNLNNRFILVLFIIMLIAVMFIDVSSSKYYGIIMLAYSLLFTFTLMVALKQNIDDNHAYLQIIKTTSLCTYEFYLLQCPVIFILNSYDIDSVFLAFALSAVLAYLLHTLLNTKQSLLKYFGIVTSLLVILIGGYYYVTAKDYTEEINALKNDLAQSEEELLIKQKEYLKKKKAQEDNYQEELSKLLEKENNIEDFVTNLNITGVGDSILLGISGSLSEKFNNIYIDAKESRSGLVVPGILQALKDDDSLGDVILVNCAINGGLVKRIMTNIMEIAGNDREVFFANVHNTSGRWNDYNNTVESFVDDYQGDNAHLLDWKTESIDYDEYFAYDNIHMGKSGGRLYSQFFFDNLCKLYKDKIQTLREEIEDKHNDELNEQYTFVGNDLLLGLSDYLSVEYDDASFVTLQNDYLLQISEYLKDDSITHNYVLCLDSQVVLTDDEYSQIIENSNDREIFIVKIRKDTIIQQKDNVHVIDFSEILTDDYYSPDKIHLNEIGNKALKDLIIEKIKSGRD